MKVAVCDDQRIILEQIREMLKKIKIVTQIRLFSDVESFLKLLREGEYYDAILMDIVWKQEAQGIAVASEIQRICPTSKIIYMTGYAMEYMEDIFLKPANLSGFIMKPVKPEILMENLEKVKREMNKTEERLVIKYKGNIFSVPLSDILYIENKLHKVQVVTEQKRYLSNENLEKVKQRLSHRFLTCHKSFVVNMDKIMEFKNNIVVLKPDVEIPVSQSRYESAKESYLRYIGEQMEERIWKP